MSMPVLHITGAGINMRLRMGAGPAVPSGGLGGWEEVERPRDTPLTDFTGQSLRRQAVPVMLNGWGQNNSVQAQLNRIESVLGKGDPPPAVKLHGPVHDTNLRWVLEDMTYEDGAIRREGDGALVRQPLTLNFVEYVAGDQIRVRRRKRRPYGGGVGPGDSFPYKTRKGETLHSIAAKLLGAAKLYRQLTGADTKDPEKPLKPGTILRLK